MTRQPMLTGEQLITWASAALQEEGFGELSFLYGVNSSRGAIWFARNGEHLLLLRLSSNAFLLYEEQSETQARQRWRMLCLGTDEIEDHISII